LVCPSFDILTTMECTSKICFLALIATTSASYSFITLGDWGGKTLGSYHSQTVSAVAEQMGQTASDSNIKFVVNTGDNFYYCGIQNTSDFQIAEDYTKIYTASSLQVPWYSALGNHEYGYSVEAQIQLTQTDPTGRWYLPSRYYTKRIQLQGAQYLTLIVTDTSPCIQKYRSSSPSGWDPCGSDFPTCSPIDEGKCKFHDNIVGQDCSQQFTWFKAQLASVNPDDWLIIVGHHPADEMDVADFASAIEDSKFALYLNGHVHQLQQYSVNGNSAFVTSGAGAMLHTSDQDNDERCTWNQSIQLKTVNGYGVDMIWSQKVAGFTLHTFNADFTELTTKFVSYQGDVLHSFTVSKGSGPTPPSPGPTPPSPGPTPQKCGGAHAWPCRHGCTYVHKANEETCGVQAYGCYDCSKLASGCPDCHQKKVCKGAHQWPCPSSCTYIHKANAQSCSVSAYGCYDCSSLPSGCPDCQSTYAGILWA